MEIIAVIPARGGSKGIPRKNIKMIAGKPLLVWSIEAAKKSKYIKRIIVSTEDEEISEVAKNAGAEVVKRPKELAEDNSPTLPAIQHVLTKVNAAVVVLLQPTSPIRDDNLIDKCVEEFKKTKVGSLATGFYCKFNKYGTCTKPRQEIKGFFYDDGNVYVINADLIRKGTLFGDKLGEVIIDKEQNIEIDDPTDFFLVEQILKKRMGLIK
ncbi:MAG: acylneuraminate cytidylyltransferase family protein [Candidatus Aenigmarchaeota archaeon]|nr:acylneuraminate cytidylyltransferase family protein [Candidatus Aenigmarchaeota archaeon]